MVIRSSGIDLPDDFITFIDKNYERIFEVEERIKQLYESSGHLLQRSDTTKSYDSSASSDHDVSKIISARIIPKPILQKTNESEEIIENHTKDWEEDSFDSDKEYLNYLTNQFPLVLFSNVENIEAIPLRVTGIPIQFSPRLHRNVHKILLHSSKNRKSRKKGKSRKNKSKAEKNGSPSTASKLVDGGNDNISKYKLPSNFPSVDEIAWEIYNRYLISSKKSQLTLPPLHSSVLTLLGQRSSTKASPRSNLLQGNQQLSQPSSTSSKHKKLRRHGRKQKQSLSPAKEIQPTDEEANDESHFILKSTDEPSNTQLSSGNLDAIDSGEGKNNLRRHSKSLFQVINENLEKTSRKYFQDMEGIDEKIAEMDEKYVKKSLLFNPSKIHMMEDAWLSLPRTWSHTSATFSIPADTRKLKSMSPLDYLQQNVTISEPRKHLYSLVYRRYRILDNPTGKTITTLTAQKGLAEVMGAALSKETLSDLFTCLNIDPNDRELTESEFCGISAFCERVYSKYPLEKCNECYVCTRDPGKSKNRCHQNQKSLLEKSDFEQLSNKLRDNEIGVTLRKLIENLCTSHLE